MPSRDAALDALSNRLAAARADPGLLLTDDALRGAAELAATTDITTDLSAAQALGWFHWNRYLSLRDRDGHSDRAAAIRYFVPVYQTSPNSVPAPIQQAIRDHEQDSARSHADPAVASSQAVLLFSIYQSNGKLPALTDAIALFREAVAAAPTGHTNHATYLGKLGTALAMLSERTGDMEALTEAIQAKREAVDAIPKGHPDRAGYLSNLGNSLQVLSARTGDTEALSEAIQAGRDAVAATPSDHPNRATRLSNLGSALRVLFGRTEDMEALTEAIQVVREAVAAAPSGHPDRAKFLDNLGYALRALFERTGDMEALTEAIQANTDAVAAKPVGHPGHASRLNTLGYALQVLFERTADAGALTQAIQAKREAVAVTLSGYPDRARYLNNLGNALYMLSVRTGDMEALTEAIQAMRDAVAAAPVGHPDRAACLSNLGNALAALSERTRDIDALTEAIQANKDAVAATPVGHPDRAAHLNNLGNALAALFERTGDMEALTEAIQAIRDAVAATPVSHPDRATCLNSLGYALHALFVRTGDMEALTEAIQAMRDAVAATPVSHRRRASRLNTLGYSLYALSERTGDMEALTEAIQAMRDAVAATPASHPGRAAHLGNLGNAVTLLSERTGDMEALTEAIQAKRDAVSAAPDGHPDRAACLSNLGYALQVLSECTGNTDALTEAIQAGRDAVAAAPSGHPDRAQCLNNLGYALRALSKRTGDTDALTEAVVCFRAAGGCTTAAAPVRIKGWRSVVVVLAGGIGEDAQEALAAAEAAVELLPQVTPRSLARTDREHQLGAVGSLAEVAAAAAIADGRPERAVELLEQTRGMLVADMVDARSSDLTRMRETAPELAGAFEELRARLDALDQPSGIHRGDLAGPDTDQNLEHARREARHLADTRHEAQAAWDQLITRIRGVDGFAGFLAAPSIRKLAGQAHDGPIVFVSASPTRCDALILTDDPQATVRLVPLTALTETAAVEQVGRLLGARRNATDPLTEPAPRMAAQGEVLEVLAWIWDTITEPVLTALGHTTTPGREQSWPRVWWSPVGVLAYLPLHAAGYHSDLTASAPALAANPRTVLDRVISSYTTTVRSLAYARTHPGTDNGKAVVVAVPDAPDTPPLPGVTAETMTLRQFLPDALVLADLTRDTVLAALPGHQVAHFACHGHADWNDPASSRLILRDHHTAPLTVADVSALHLNGGLAYLSACDTTVTSPRLVDEAVHITGAFHLAGYQHVIGTLWPVSDAAAHDITKDFYADLTADGRTPPQTSRSAQALHHAIRHLRARYPQTPTLWAAHTHTGT